MRKWLWCDMGNECGSDGKMIVEMIVEMIQKWVVKWWKSEVSWLLQFSGDLFSGIFSRFYKIFQDLGYKIYKVFTNFGSKFA